MNYLDIFVSVIILFGAARGFSKGLFIELAGLVGLVAGVYGAIHFSYFVGDFLKNKIGWSHQTTSLVAFGITFVLIVIGVSLVGKILTKVADLVSLELPNKIAGAVFGGLKMILILGVALNYFTKINDTFTLMDKKNIEQSLLLEFVQDTNRTLLPSLEKLSSDSGKIINQTF